MDSRILLLLVAGGLLAAAVANAQAGAGAPAGDVPDPGPPDPGAGDGSGLDLAPLDLSSLDALIAGNGAVSSDAGVFAIAPESSSNDTAPPSSSTTTTPRGIRNNNPGNLVATNIAWLGKTGNDGTFEIFDTPAHGIRAMAINLLTKFGRGLTTIAQIVDSWTATDKASYTAAVSRMMGVPATLSLNLRDVATLTGFVGAIITQENGYNPYPASTIAAGVNAALG